MKIVYYLIIFPLSHLPLRFLYLFERPLVVIIFKIFKYRRKIIELNISNSFVNQSRNKHIEIKKDFERHFVQLLIEGIKNMSISKTELMRRFEFENTKLIDDLIFKNKNVVIVSSHFCNWEWLITSLGIHFNTRIFGIGMPLSNGFFNKKLNTKRERFGLRVIDSSNYKMELNDSNSPFAVLTLSDQSPSSTENAYWINFLNQDTGVIIGPEIISNQYKAAVVYMKICKKKKGYYTCSVVSITDDASNSKFGEITEMHTRILENQIIQNPSYWLWSHKRWKREAPNDKNLLYEIQRERFNSKFKK